MFKLGDHVKLNWEKGIGNLENDELRMPKISYNERKNILMNWDVNDKNNHIITDKMQNLYTNNMTAYELDNEYWFDEDEIIFVNNTKMFNKDNIMKIEYATKIGNYTTQMVALYNKTKITENEVLKAIGIAEISQNDNVIFITQKAFDNVFND